MPRVSPPAGDTSEHELLAFPARDLAITVVVLALTVAAFMVVAQRAMHPWVQELDDAWQTFMVEHRSPPLTAAALLLNFLGLALVTLPIRLGIVGFLAVKRRWWHLAAFASAVVLSEILIGPLKAAYSRERPPDPLVATTGASFPSGHAVAASVTVIAAVIALVPAGRRRAVWGSSAAAFAIVMALSRAYLGAHWLSDAVAGTLFGASCALVTALAVGILQRRAAVRRVDEAEPWDIALPRDRP